LFAHQLFFSLGSGVMHIPRSPFDFTSATTLYTLQVLIRTFPPYLRRPLFHVSPAADFLPFSPRTKLLLGLFLDPKLGVYSLWLPCPPLVVVCPRDCYMKVSLPRSPSYCPSSHRSQSYLGRTQLIIPKASFPPPLGCVT